MKKKDHKPELKKLEIQSFVTQINEEEKETIQGATMATFCCPPPAIVTTAPCGVFATIISITWLTKQTMAPPQGNCPPFLAPGCGAGASCIGAPDSPASCINSGNVMPPPPPANNPPNTNQNPSGFGMPCNSNGGTCETEIIC